MWKCVFESFFLCVSVLPISICFVPLSSNRQYLSCDACLEVKREDNQNCSVLYDSCAQWYAHKFGQFLQFSGLGFIMLGSFHCAYLCLYVCSLFFCFLLHICHSIVSVVGWIWRDWGLILRTKLPSLPWHCWLDHMLSLIHIWRCRRIERCRSRWSPYH